MEASKDVRKQLDRLRIGKGQRPKPESGRSRRSGGWIVVIGLAVIGVTGFALRNQLGSWGSAFDKATEVELVAATVRHEASSPPILTATGKIVSDHLVNVATKVSGQIVALSFEQGDSVRRGDQIARIEDVNYRARRDKAAAMLEQSKARLEFARVNFDRIQTLYEADNAPEIEFVNARGEFEAAKAQVLADTAELTEAQWRWDECAVKAPINGVVLERNVEVGDFVAAEGGFGGMANSQFAVIADMSKLRVEVDISELDIAKIEKDMPCRITPDAYKDTTFDGYVMWIDPAANYSKATVQVKVRIEDPNAMLRVDGTARVDFASQRLEDEADAGRSIWLPNSAVVQGESTTSAVVFVFSESRLTEVHVALGRSTGREVEILSGLKPGSQVVSRAGPELRDGQKVRPAAGQQ
ncbi:MAG: efflux RND transporter periplasmic adaptor subunit [Planctomycetota bacterium]|nr:efflux RND transporter periplasmic adaptor subunit [Planctomycetota bacterium]